MTFLPKGYDGVPKSGGNYTKLQDGSNRLRILSSAITGWIYWTEEDGKRKPVRLADAPISPPADMAADGKVKHFWAFTVWNYDAKAIQILEITQSTIQDAIMSLIEDSDWGDPKQYDLKINRTGESLDTKYNVSPAPASPLEDEVTEAFEATPVNLDALYDGGDPFEHEANETVPAV